MAMLSTTDHSRDSVGHTYVYPVISRRAGGVSVGINLNVNNACNWACIYCQVPDLKRGAPPPVRLGQLADELRAFLKDATEGDFMVSHVPAESRRLVDIAFSGNGEPTSSAEFSKAVLVVKNVLRGFDLLDKLKLRVITNGSLVGREGVQQGLASIGEANGEIWFKLDRATEAGVARINGVRFSPARIRASLLRCTELAPTWLQTCYFAIDGAPPDEAEQSAYLEIVEFAREKVMGVHLYGLARPSLQPDAQRLSNASQENFMCFADKISAIGVKVVANP